MELKHKISYRELLLIYFTVGSRAFGGWSTTYLLLEKEFIEKRSTLSVNQLKAAAASGQTLPGPAQVIIAAQVAYYLKGATGAIVAATAYLLPSTILTVLFSFVYFTYLKEIDVARYTLGLQAAVGGIIIGNAYKIGKSQAEIPLLWGIAALAALVCFITQLPAIIVIISFGVIGLIANFIKQRGSRG